jgi:hypothetical protein
MAQPAILFGVPYNRHTVDNLKFFLHSVSRPYKSSFTKGILFSTLQDFEKSLSPEAQATLVTYTQSYYDTRNASIAARVKRNLGRALRRLSQEHDTEKEDENNQVESGEENAQNNTKSARKSDKTDLKKRKYSQISKGYPKMQKNKTKASKFCECSVCYESLPNKNFPEDNITINCEHDNSVCTVCIGAHIDARVDIGQFGFITCPMCPETLALEDVRRLCGAETFERFVTILFSVSLPLTLVDRYDRLVTMTAVQKDPTFHFCLGSGCGFGQYNNDEKSHKMVCGNCDFATCTYHGMAWHEGQTCGEYDDEVDRAEKPTDHTRRMREHSELRLKEAEHELNAVMEREMTLQERKETERRGPRLQQAMKAKAAREEAGREEAGREEARREEVRQKALANAEALRRKHYRENKASLATVKSIAKTCPNMGCGAQIQKIAGCDHMTCKCLSPSRPSADSRQVRNVGPTSAGRLFK